MDIFTEHPKPEVKIAVIFLKRRRPGFLPEWGVQIEGMAREQLKTAPFSVFVPERKVVDVPSLRLALDDCHANHCDVLVVLQPTMSDGSLSPVLGQSGFGPVVLWATPEKPEGEMVSACSLVGAHNFAANLVQAGYPFDFLYGMPGAASTCQALERAVYRSYAYSVINGASAGLIGYHVPGFIDMHVDPTSLRSGLNVDLFHFGLQEFSSRVDAVGEAEARADLQQVKKLNLRCANEISEADLLLSSRYYLSLKDLMETMSLDALGIRDWPELSATQWPYLAISRLVSEGYAIACEGDVDGALSSLLAYAAGCGVSYLSDWLEHDDEHITLWHGGAAPFQFCAGPESVNPPEITTHFNTGKPAVVNATLKEGLPVTLFRLWHLNGAYFFTALEGETVKPKRHLKGTNGFAYFPTAKINDYFLRLLQAGFPHHPVLAQGHLKSHLYRVVEMFGVQCLD